MTSLFKLEVHAHHLMHACFLPLLFPVRPVHRNTRLLVSLVFHPPRTQEYLSSGLTCSSLHLFQPHFFPVRPVHRNARLLLSIQKLVDECGLSDIVPKVWVDHVEAVLPNTTVNGVQTLGYHVSGLGGCRRVGGCRL